MRLAPKFAGTFAINVLSSALFNMGAAQPACAQVRLPSQALASQISDKAKATDGSAEAVSLAQGDRALRVGNLLLAEQQYRSALQEQPKSVAALTRLARLLDGDQQHTAAQTLWKQVIALEPGNDGYAVDLANSYLNDNKPQAAVALLTPFATREGVDPNVLLDLGTAFARQDRYQDAIPFFRRAAEASPAPGMAQLSLAKSLTTLMQFEEAKPVIEGFLTSHPKDYDALLVAGTVYESLLDWKQAESALQRALQLRPDSFDVLSRLGTVEKESLNLDGATVHLVAAEQLRPEAKEVHYLLLRIYRAQGNLTLAKDEERRLRSAEETDTRQTQATVLGNAAATALAAGRYQEAIQTYERVLGLVSNKARVHYDLALIYERTGERAKENELLNEAEQEDAALAGPHSQKGFLYLSQSRMADAETELRRAIAIDPEAVETLGNLGVLCAKTGKLAEAEHYLRLAVANDPAYSKGYVNLGLVLASENRLGEAAVVLRNELARDPQDEAAAAALQAVTSRPRLTPVAHR